MSSYQFSAEQYHQVFLESNEKVDKAKSFYFLTGALALVGVLVGVTFLCWALISPSIFSISMTILGFILMILAVFVHYKMESTQKKLAVSATEARKEIPEMKELEERKTCEIKRFEAAWKEKFPGKKVEIVWDEEYYALKNLDFSLEEYPVGLFLARVQGIHKDLYLEIKDRDNEVVFSDYLKEINDLEDLQLAIARTSYRSSSVDMSGASAAAATGGF